MQVVFHKKRLCAASFPVSTWSPGSWIKETFLFSFWFIAASSQSACAQPAVLSTCWPLPLASAQLETVTWGGKSWSVNAWGGKCDSSVSTGSSSFSPLRVLLFTCSVDGFQLSQAAIPSWIPGFVQSSVLTLPLCSFCSVTCTSSTAQPGRWRHLCSFSVSAHATSTCMD